LRSPTFPRSATFHGTSQFSMESSQFSTETISLQRRSANFPWGQPIFQGVRQFSKEAANFLRWRSENIFL
jgi:hypothetical protein